MWFCAFLVQFFNFREFVLPVMTRPQWSHTGICQPDFTFNTNHFAQFCIFAIFPWRRQYFRNMNYLSNKSRLIWENYLNIFGLLRWFHAHLCPADHQLTPGFEITKYLYFQQAFVLDLFLPLHFSIHPRSAPNAPHSRSLFTIDSLCNYQHPRVPNVPAYLWPIIP